MGASASTAPHAMPRKKATTPETSAPEAPVAEPAADVESALVDMVAGPDGFSCKAHEGSVAPDAPFTTTEDRAVVLESRNLATRKG